MPAAVAQTTENASPEKPASKGPADDNNRTPGQMAAPPTGIWERPNLFGDMGGLRPWLGKYGVTLNLQETSEYLNNLSGGTKRGGAYDGLTQVSVAVDTEKAVGLTGGSFYVSALQIHGANLTQRNLQTLQSATGIEANERRALHRRSAVCAQTRRLPIQPMRRRGCPVPTSWASDTTQIISTTSDSTTRACRSRTRQARALRRLTRATTAFTR